MSNKKAGDSFHPSFFLPSKIAMAKNDGKILNQYKKQMGSFPSNLTASTETIYDREEFRRLLMKLDIK